MEELIFRETTFKRSQLEMIEAILRTCTEPKKTTHLLYETKLSYRTFKDILGYLLQKNLLNEIKKEIPTKLSWGRKKPVDIPKGRPAKDGYRHYYITTTLGCELLQLLDKIKNIFGESNPRYTLYNLGR